MYTGARAGVPPGRAPAARALLLRPVGTRTTLSSMAARHPSFSRASAAAVGAAIAAAALGYSIHHVGPLEGHALETVVFGVGLATLIAAVPAAVAASRQDLPQLIPATPGSYDVRAADAGDASFCAAVHTECLAHGFFTQLGSSFLRAYHRTFVDSPHAVAFVATVGDVRVGMLVGVIRPDAHARWVMRHRGVPLAILGAIGLLRRPVTAIRFLRLRASRYVRGWRRKRRRDIAPPAHAESAVLSHVAVRPGARRSGAGRRLVTAFIDACRTHDVPRATLLSLESSPGAGAFYAELGWRPGRVRITPDGLRMREWILFPRDGGR
jgi:GNAT superfamily N-acetyltransferase